VRVKWCRECGRLGAGIFSYCPFCGTEYAEKPDAEELMERGMAGIAAKASASPKDGFGRASLALDELERDIQDILDEAGWLAK
jgi:hypothetical protein